jgi:glycosyltransferase involved in cell wall biosynthesis
MRPRKVVEIPHGPFQLSDVPLPYEEGAEIVALLLGTLRENKNIHLAIRAVQRMRANGYPIRLVIAGKAYTLEMSYWLRCKALIESSPAGITVIDRYLEDEELKDIVAGAHLFLLPYTEFHSQSGVAALALSNGRPILATRAGGLSELLLPGRTGVWIERPTAESIEEALLRAVRLGHYGLRQMGQEAFAFFKARYSWHAIAREYIALYQEIGTKPQR